MSQIKTAQYFKNNVATYNLLNKKYNQRSDLISGMRIAVVIISMIFLFLNYFYGNFNLIGMILLSGIILFIGLIIAYNKTIKLQKKIGLLVKINKQYLDRLNGNWAFFANTGSQYSNLDHSYSNDLKIVGQYSLFQLINTTTTFLGEQFLIQRLHDPIYDVELIKLRQEAIQELGLKINWCQSFEMLGYMSDTETINLDSLVEWGRMPVKFNNFFFIILIQVLPFILLLNLGLVYFSNYFIYSLFALFFIQGLLTLYSYIYLTSLLKSIYSFKEQLNAIINLLRWIESEPFASSILANQKDLLFSNYTLASQQIRLLNWMADCIDIKFSPLLHFLLNLIFLWDFQFIILLDKWKLKSGHQIKLWLETIAVFEELSSFATLTHYELNGCYPNFTNNDVQFDAVKIGHPLINSKDRVCNDVKLNKACKIAIITGSNMSGKSTFLRTLGINLVLALSGAPVCAKKLICSPLSLYTSISIVDNLSHNVSTFYGEIQRINQMVKAVKIKRPFLFLIDEIFSGTNSHDRFIGAEKVMNIFFNAKSLGLVSTHDQKITELNIINSFGISNFHFREYYNDDQLFFDYLLYPGISKTTNGLKFLKMIGI